MICLAAERMFAAGYGNTIGTTAAGATIRRAGQQQSDGAGSWSTANSVATIADAAVVKDVTDTIITDVQFERSTGGGEGAHPTSA